MINELPTFKMLAYAEEISGRGAAKHRGSVRASLLTSLGSIPNVPMIVSPWNSWNFHDVAEINRRL